MDIRNGVYGKNAYGLPSVDFCLEQACLGRMDLHKILSPARTTDELRPHAIRNTIEKNRSLSAICIAQLPNIALNTVCRYLKENWE
jgi:hypothetical protein